MIGNQRLQVAKRFYCESEYQKILHAGSEEEQIRMFYRYWTLKESFMKVTREGLALDMSSYEIAWRENGDPYLAHQPEKYPGQYYYKEYFEKGIDACMSVCSTDAQIDGKLYVMKL
jgi:4'-phosphopantetheinyl transferase